MYEQLAERMAGLGPSLAKKARLEREREDGFVPSPSRGERADDGSYNQTNSRCALALKG